MSASTKPLLHCLILLLSCLLIAGMSLRGSMAEPRCRCIATESRRIGKLIGKVVVYSPSPHCTDTEMIATLKNGEKEICLDPNARWVKRVIHNILKRQQG